MKAVVLTWDDGHGSERIVGKWVWSVGSFCKSTMYLTRLSKLLCCLYKIVTTRFCLDDERWLKFHLQKKPSVGQMFPSTIVDVILRTGEVIGFLVSEDLGSIKFMEQQDVVILARWRSEFT